MKQSIHINYEILDRNELTEQEQILVDKSIDAFEGSYSPYSNFKVGAALLLDNGEIVNGSNQENAAYPSGLCAERVVMFYANAKYPNSKPLVLAIAAMTQGELIESPISPCGACRQVLLESEVRYDYPITILLVGRNKVYKIDSVKTLLPFQFDKSAL